MAAAASLLKKRGVDGLTIRAVASELGVAPMSLYRHVRDKEDLLGETVDTLLGRTWKPQVAESDWTAWLAESAERFTRFLVGEPAALQVYLNERGSRPAAEQRRETITRLLADALGDEERSRQAFDVLHAYTIGFAALEARGDQRISAEASERLRGGVAMLLAGLDRQGGRATKRAAT